MGEGRSNVSVACNECRRSKAKCDAVDPCFHCRRKQMPCVYPMDPVKRGPKKGTKYKKRQKVDDGVAVRVGSDDGEEAAAGPAPVEAARVKDPSTPAPRPAPRRAASSRAALDVVTTVELDIPLEIVHHLVTLFFSHVNNQAFPILREAPFLASFADGRITPALVYAICAAASRFSTHPAIDATSSEACALSARRSSAYQDDVLQAVQTHAILSVHELARGNGKGAWLDAGFAMRTAQVARFDDDSVDVEDDGVREDRQRIVWCLWALEAVMGCGSSSVSLTGGGSTSAMELLPLPTSVNASLAEGAASDDDGSSREDDVPPIFLKGGRVFHSISSYGVEPFLCRILHIFGNINRHVVISSQARMMQPRSSPESKSTTHYPSSSLPDTTRLRDWDASSQFGQLSLDLNAWSAQLPAQLTFNANVTANLPLSSISPFYTMHLVLHLSQVLLHRPYIPDYRHQSRQVPLPSPSEGFAVFASACHRKAAVHAINFARTLVACTKSATFAISPLAGYGAFTAATALLFDVELGATSNSAASQALQFFVDYLLTGSEYFYSLKSYHDTLSRLIVIHQTTAIEPAGSADIKNPPHFFERYASAGIIEPSLAPLDLPTNAPLPIAAIERIRSERDTTADAAGHLLQLAEIMDDFLHAPTSLGRPTSPQAGPVQHRLLINPQSIPANVPAFPDGNESFSWLFHHGAPAPERHVADNGHTHDVGMTGDIWENQALEALLSSCEWTLYPGEERPTMDAGFYHGHLD